LELRSYLTILRRRATLILLCVAVAAVAGYLNTSSTTLYTSQATVYVGVSRLADNSTDAQRTTDALLSIERSILTFAIMIDSRTTAASALQRTGLARSAQSVLDATVAYPIPDTQLIVVKAADPDPAVARDLANAVAESFVADVQKFEPGTPATEGSFPSLPAYLFERAQVPTTPLTPPLLRNLIVAALFGFIAAAALAFLLEYLDITVKGASDAEHRLELPVLAVVPRSRSQLAPDSARA
jgi:capsular polysaccharide biosynthesis protein